MPQEDWVTIQGNFDRETAEGLANNYVEEGVRAKVVQVGNLWRVLLHPDDYDRYLKRIQENRLKILREHAKSWDGVNLQSQGLAPPLPNENRLELYIMDVTSKEVKNFKVSTAMKLLLDRSISWVSYGTTQEEWSSYGTNRQLKVVLAWVK